MTDNLNDLLFAYIEQMKVKNYAKATMTAYSRYLRTFLEYLREQGIIDLKQCSRDTLTAYQVKLMELKAKGENTIATVSIKIRAVKRFFEYLEETNHILINPAEYIKEPKKETRLPRVVLTGEEARKILDMPNLSTMTGIRDRTILEVFYTTGIRLEEMVNLTIYDCDLQGGLLRVNKGKFAKDRVVPLGRHAVKFLKEYITRIRPYYTKGRTKNKEHPPNNRWASRTQTKKEKTRILFVSQSGKPLSTQVIQIMVRNYAKEAGIKKHVTPHVFRHTFATELVRNGADITAVQKMLGHSTLSITQIYTKVAGVEVKKTHSAHHPRERDKAVREEITPEIRPEIRHNIRKFRGRYYNAKPD